MSKNQVYAHTQTRNNYKEDQKITSKQWKIYYYMLSVSKFNTQKIEDHRYIYKKDFNITQVCRLLGIKSTQTFYNAIKRLTENRLVRDQGEYYFLYAKNWININQDILLNLVDYAKIREQDIDLLRTFLILKKLDKIAGGAEERAFTKRDLIILLGHNPNDTVFYNNIRTYLALLSFWGLIELKVHTANHTNLGHYTIYHLQKVNDNTLNPDFISNINAEKDVMVLSQELKDRLRVQFPELLEENTFFN